MAKARQAELASLVQRLQGRGRRFDCRAEQPDAMCTPNRECPDNIELSRRLRRTVAGAAEPSRGRSWAGESVRTRFVIRLYLVLSFEMGKQLTKELWQDRSDRIVGWIGRCVEAIVAAVEPPTFAFPVLHEVHGGNGVAPVARDEDLEAR